MNTLVQKFRRKGFGAQALLIGVALASATLAMSARAAAAAQQTDVGWRVGGGVGAGVMLPRSCDRCPASSARGIAFGIEVSAPLAHSWQLTATADARLLGYSGGSTGTLNDLSLSLQHWPSLAALAGRLWIRGGVAVAQLTTSLGDAVDPMGGQSKQFRRVGPAWAGGIGYELPHLSPWTFEFSLKALAAFFSDAPAFSLVAAFGVVWH